MSEMVVEVVNMVLFIWVVTVCIIAPLVWLALWMGRRMKEGSQDAAGAAAAHFGLQPEPLEAPMDPAMASPGPVYKGFAESGDIWDARWGPTDY